MPSYNMEVGPDIENPSHHLMLTAENGEEYGLILADSKGDRLKTAVARSNLQTAPVKTSSGESQYSDAELPFLVSSQSNFEGGRGGYRFEADQTKYADGARVQTVNGNVILGPREHVGYGYQPMIVQQPGEGRQGYGKIGRLQFTYEVNLEDNPAPNAIASRFYVGNDAITPDSLWLYGKGKGAVGYAAWEVTWEICADGGSEPGAVQSTGIGKPLVEGSIMQWIDMTLETTNPATLNASTWYWLVLKPNSGAEAYRCFEMGYYKDPANGPGGDINPARSTVISYDHGVTWEWNGGYDDEYQMMFHLEEETLGRDTSGWFFWYRHQLYWISKGQGSGNTQFIMNGWRGCADVAGESGVLKDSTQSGTGWQDDGAVGCVIRIIAGPGSEEEYPYREVTASENGKLTCGPWSGLTHTVDTEYVVLRSNYWQEVPNSIPDGVTGKPCVAVGGSPPDVSHTILYIPQGHEDLGGAIWMYRGINDTAGNFIHQDKSINDATGDKGNYRCKLMINYIDDTDGPIQVKLEDNQGLGVTNLVAQARLPGTWEDQPAWNPDEQLGGSQSAGMMNAIEYVDNDDARTVWCITRDELWARNPGLGEGDDSGGLWNSILLPELKAWGSNWTGYALAVWDTSLMVSLVGGLVEKLQGAQFIDMSPQGELGLPAWRQGEITSMVSYPGQLFVAMHASADSTIWRMRGNAEYDPIYVAPGANKIGDMMPQHIPGDVSGYIKASGRLWFKEGSKLMWIDLPNPGHTPLTDLNYQFATEGNIATSVIHTNLADRRKVYSSLKLITENLDDTAHVEEQDWEDGNEDTWYLDEIMTSWIDWEFRIDADAHSGSWGTTYSPFHTSPSQEEQITHYTWHPTRVTARRGKHVEFRFNLNTVEGCNETPVIKGWVLEQLLSLPNKYQYAATVVFEDKQTDLNDVPYTDTTAWEQVGKLEELAEYGEIFTLNSISATLDGAKVIISPVEITPLAITSDTVPQETSVSASLLTGAGTEKLLGQLSIIQVVLLDGGLVDS